MKYLPYKSKQKQEYNFWPVVLNTNIQAQGDSALVSLDIRFLLWGCQWPWEGRWPNRHHPFLPEYAPAADEDTFLEACVRRGLRSCARGCYRRWKGRGILYNFRKMCNLFFSCKVLKGRRQKSNFSCDSMKGFCSRWCWTKISFQSRTYNILFYNYVDSIDMHIGYLFLNIFSP